MNHRFNRNGPETRTTIIIPNYNGLSFLGPCLESLKQQTVHVFKVLVVDNGSTDGSVQWLREQGIPSIFLDHNTGFPGAVNAGIRAADTPYVLLLNNDTAAEPRFVEFLERAIGRSETIFSVSSRVLQMHRPELLDDAGDMFSVMGWAYQRGVGREMKRYDRPCRIFSACAAAAIYRREVFEKIGYFDEAHFAYLEDIDIGYRARLFGYDNVYCPEALVRHVGSGTSGSKYNPFKVRLAARNSVYLNYKNMPLLQLAVNALPLAFGYAVKIRFFSKRGFGADYRAGLKEGFSTLKKCRRVPFRVRNLGRYLRIEWELIVNTFIYASDLIKRRVINL